MKMKVQASDLKDALDVVGIVTPRPVTAQGGAGYLFIVRDGKAFIYSRDALHQSRVDVAVEDAEDGAFIFPVEKIGTINYLDGVISIEAGYDEGDDRHWVRYSADGGAKQEFSSYDPRLMSSIDEALANAKQEVVFPAGVLREGINLTKSFLTKPGDTRVQEHFQTLQLFDDSKDAWKKGNGTLYAANGTCIAYFFCEAFMGKGMSIHGQHLSFLTSFLSKCSGNVTVRTGDGVSFAVNSMGQVFGWVHSVKEHQKYSYYPPAQDKFVLRVVRDHLVKALRYVRAGLDSKRDRIRISYEDNMLRFMGSEGSGQIDSMPVGVKPIVEEGGGGQLSATEGFAFNINLNQFLDLVEPMKANDADLRVGVIAANEKRPKDVGLFRTIEVFNLDASGKQVIADEDSKEEVYQCRVTRFMPSRE